MVFVLSLFSSAQCRADLGKERPNPLEFSATTWLAPISTSNVVTGLMSYLKIHVFPIKSLLTLTELIFIKLTIFYQTNILEISL